MKRVAIVQSNYMPWKGYFDIIYDVDLFVFYDDVQYTKNDWRNRNKIKAHNGATWLTVPVGSRTERLICDVELLDDRWASQHWKSIQQYYSKAPYFDLYKPFFEDYLIERSWKKLSDLNQFFIRTVANELLDIDVQFLDSRDFNLHGSKSERLIALLQQMGATTYISGPSARSYIDERMFRQTGIDLVYKTYGPYPEYRQLFPPFVDEVSVIDLLFNTGPEACRYIWG